MSQSDDNTDKQHEPTQKKLDDARKKGEIPRSADLSVAASYAGLLLCALMAGATSFHKLGETFSILLDQASSIAPLIFEGDARAPLGGLAYSVVLGILPWFAFPLIIVLTVITAQRGFTFAPSKIQLKTSRISPLSNAKNKYGRTGLFEFFKSFTKLVIYSACLGLFLNARMPELSSAPMGEAGFGILLLLRVSTEFILVAFLIALSIGALDFLWQRAEHMRKNRMSDKELREEHKEAEGDPHMKQTRRNRGQEIALNQMMADVPTADVVIVNPTHFAVALKWSRARGEAPVCIAKGVDEIALKIRDAAQEAQVPVRSDPPTARALHATTKIGDEIQPEHYRAVAAAIRFAEMIRKRAAWRQ